jgi:hypothetical protein
MPDGRHEVRMSMTTGDRARLAEAAARMDPPMRPNQLLALLLTGQLKVLEEAAGDVTVDELRALAVAFGGDPAALNPSTPVLPPFSRGTAS